MPSNTKRVEKVEKPGAADLISSIQESIRRHARYSLGKAWNDLSGRELFNAFALSVRDRLVDQMLEPEERYRKDAP